jgi:nucleoside-diphosphate-sugar epimerase
MNHYTLRPRTLVTGGASFLGSPHCERLLADGHDLICLDNFSTEAKENFLHLLENPNFELTHHDVAFPLYTEVEEIYNMACPASPIHMVEMAEKICDLIGSRSELVYKPLPADDPKQRQPDNEFARRELGWSPQVLLEEGLKPTIAYFDTFIRRQAQ